MREGSVVSIDSKGIPRNPSGSSSVLGWGLGLKEVGSCLTRTIARRAYVERKIALADLPPGDRVPAFLGGMPTDVVERSLSQIARYGNKSLAGGMRLVNARGVPGTLSCLAWCRATKARVLVGNWHVLFGQGASAGDRVFLVRTERSRLSYTTIGRTRRGLLGTTLHDGLKFHVDLAIATYELDPGFGTTDTASGTAASPRALAWTYPGAVVGKYGAGSGATTGIVVDIAYPDVAVIDGHPLLAPRQILVRSAGGAGSKCFAQSGDSGALLFRFRRSSDGPLVGKQWPRRRYCVSPHPGFRSARRIPGAVARNLATASLAHR